mmetsp:Transcript_43201/g.112053  ORF Transcript_43201/g.112053 Transcript_43201/m.112053 type:complete len:179 (-) Transcript_43201:2166-2702(-)
MSFKDFDSTIQYSVVAFLVGLHVVITTIASAVRWRKLAARKESKTNRGAPTRSPPHFVLEEDQESSAQLLGTQNSHIQLPPPEKKQDRSQDEDDVEHVGLKKSQSFTFRLSSLVGVGVLFNNSVASSTTPVTVFCAVAATCALVASITIVLRVRVVTEVVVFVAYASLVGLFVTPFLY